MQVVSYSDGVAQIEIPQDDLNDMISIVKNAGRLEEELLSGVQNSGLPLIDDDVRTQILGSLNSAKSDPSTEKAILSADKGLSIYLATILTAAAQRSGYVDFPRDDGTLIDMPQKMRLSDQLYLTSLGFNPEEKIQFLERVLEKKIPRFTEP